MPRYLSKQKNGDWHYQMAVPEPLRKLMGKAIITRYIGPMSQRDAENKRDPWVVQDKRQLNTLKSLTDAEKAEIERNGGLKRLRANAPLWAMHVERLGPVVENGHLIDIAKVVADNNARGARVTAGDIAGALWQTKVEVADWKARLAVLDKTADRPQHTTLADLLELWQRIQRPAITRRHATTVRLFEEIVGERADVRTIAADDVAKFRDAHARDSYSSQEKHLKNLKAIFAVAVSERKMPYNPATVIRPIEPLRQQLTADGTRGRDSFTGAQLRLILETASAARWGGPKRHADAMWALRLMIWTGAGPREVCQLRKADIETVDGVPCIHFQVTHPEQSLKTDSRARRTPLHKAIAAEFMAFVETVHGPWLFRSFEHRGEDGRAAWFTDAFNRMLRQACKITDKKLSLYSTRHSFHDAVRNAGLHPDVQRLLVGHAARDVHDGYGSKGVAMALLKASLDQVDPFSG
jgi:integrase